VALSSAKNLFQTGMKRITTILAIASVFIVSARAQGFQNLNFESAYNLPGNPGSGALVSATNALPDRTGYNADNALSDVYYVSNSLGDVSGSVELEGGSQALSGDFSVALFLGGSISQTGSVPDDAESLEFEAQGPGSGGSLGSTDLSVMLGGQSLSYSALSDGPDYVVYGASIPGDMQGQTAALTFLVQGLTPGVLLDNIDFSTMSVPEPSEWAFIGLGVVAFGFWKRSASKVGIRRFHRLRR
jgi:hypothetical protein